MDPPFTFLLLASINKGKTDVESTLDSCPYIQVRLKSSNIFAREESPKQEMTKADTGQQLCFGLTGRERKLFTKRDSFSGIFGDLVGGSVTLNPMESWVKNRKKLPLVFFMCIISSLERRLSCWLQHFYALLLSFKLFLKQMMSFFRS